MRLRRVEAELVGDAVKEPSVTGTLVDLIEIQPRGLRRPSRRPSAYASALAGNSAINVGASLTVNTPSRSGTALPSDYSGAAFTHRRP